MRVTSAALSILLGFDLIVAQPRNAQTNAPAFHLLETTIDDVHAALKSGRTTCRQLVELYLRRIDAYDKSGPALNAVQTVNRRALEDAAKLDAALTAGAPVGALHCIPVLIKDQVDTSDITTTYGAAVCKAFVPQTDATIVTKLKQAGAVIVGKATMGEFASGYLSSASGPIRNAYDPRRHASGSSGGTGAGIAANFATVGIGEDTGGSVRGPASVGSLVGLRPTLPLVSRHGMFPARPTTDTLGPMAGTVRDAAIVFDAIVGYDPRDPVTVHAFGQIPASYAMFLAPDGLSRARIGVLREPMDAKTDPASDDYKKVRAVIDRAIGELKGLGVEIADPITIPGVIDRVTRAYDGNVFETEPAINRFLEAHAKAPVKTLSDILLSGESRAVTHESVDGDCRQVDRRCRVSPNPPDRGRDTPDPARRDGGQAAGRRGVRDLRPPACADSAGRDDSACGRRPHREQSTAESDARFPGDHRAGGVHQRRAPRRARVPWTAVRRADAVQIRLCLRAGDPPPQAAG